MKLKFLGTAAAEGWPALFCKCDACMKAAKLGGKNIRTRASCMIDDIYMVDFSADTYMHKLEYNLDLSKVEHLFITHSHYDHFYPMDLEVRKDGFAYIEDKKMLNVYGNRESQKRFDYALGNLNVKDDVVYKFVEPFKYFKAGDASVMPLPANHSKDENCYIYIIEIGGKVLLYGHDSGYFKEDVWDELSHHHFDGVVLDCTFGPRESWEYHMGISADKKVKDRMIEMGAADSGTKFILNHFSHNGGMLHDELENIAKPYNFIVAYDGLEIEI